MVTWLINDKVVSPASESINRLIIPSASTRMYLQCRGENKHGRKNTGTWLMVSQDRPYSAPVFTHDLPKQLKIAEGGQINLTCKAEGYPVPTVQWFENGDPVGEPADSMKELVLTDIVQPVDAKCKAQNLGGTVEFNTVIGIIPKEVGEKPRITSRFSPTRRVTKGTDASFDCIAKGDPLPEVRLFKDGVVVPTQRTVLGRSYFVEKAVTSAFTVVCEAVNKFGLAQTSTDVVIEEPPEPEKAPQFTSDHKPKLEIYPGQTVNVTCTAVGHPVPTVTWSLDGKSIGTPSKGTSQLTLSNIIKDSILMCSASNSVDVIDRETSIFVIEDGEMKKPKIMQKLPEKTKLQRGKDVSLTCRALGDPVPTVLWFKDNKNVITNYEKPGFNFYKERNITESFTLRCEALNKFGKAETSTQVEVEEIPQTPIPVHLPKQIPAEFGEKINITCEFKGHPRPMVQWFNETVPLGPGVESKNELVIESVEKNSKLKCRGVNDYGYAETNTNLIVRKGNLQKPKHQPTSTEIVVEEGENVSIPCQFSGFPPPDIAWYANTVQLGPADKVKNFLFIPKAERSAVLTCVGQNKAGSVSVQYTLTVRPKVKPYVVTLLANVSEATEAVNLEIRWRVEKGNINAIRNFSLQLTDTFGNVLMGRLKQEPNARYFKIFLNPSNGNLPTIFVLNLLTYTDNGMVSNVSKEIDITKKDKPAKKPELCVELFEIRETTAKIDVVTQGIEANDFRIQVELMNESSAPVYILNSSTPSPASFSIRNLIPQRYFILTVDAVDRGKKQFLKAIITFRTPNIGGYAPSVKVITNKLVPLDIIGTTTVQPTKLTKKTTSSVVDKQTTPVTSKVTRYTTTDKTSITRSTVTKEKTTDKPDTVTEPTEKIDEVTEPTEKIDEVTKPTEKIDEVTEPTEKIDVVTEPTEKIDEVTEPTEKIDEVTEPTEKIDEVTEPTEKIDEVTEPTEKIDEVTEPTDEVTEPTEKIDEVTEPTEKIDEVTEPTEKIDEVTEPTEKIDEVTEPTDEVTEPTEKIDEVTEPTDEVTEPTEKIDEVTEPTEKIDEVTEPTEKIDEVTEPTEKIDEVTEPTEKIDEVTEPTDEVTEPTEKIDEVTEPTEKIDEVTEPTEKIDEATEPTDEVTEPTDEATEPTDEATEPTDEASNMTQSQTTTATSGTSSIEAVDTTLTPVTTETTSSYLVEITTEEEDKTYELDADVTYKSQTEAIIRWTMQKGYLDQIDRFVVTLTSATGKTLMEHAVDANQRVLKVSGLTPSKNYSANVKAYGPGGVLAEDNVWVGTASFKPDQSSPSLLLEVNEVRATNVRLNWQMEGVEPSEVKEYRVEVFEKGPMGENLVTSSKPGDVNDVVLLQLSPKQQYYVVLTTVGHDGKEIMSTSATFNTPSTKKFGEPVRSRSSERSKFGPGAVIPEYPKEKETHLEMTLKPDGPRKTKIAWKPVGKDADSVHTYRLSILNRDGDTHSIKTLPAITTELVSEDLETDQPYIVKLEALNQDKGLIAIKSVYYYPSESADTSPDTFTYIPEETTTTATSEMVESPMLTLDISPEGNNETKLDWRMVGESRSRPVGTYSLKVNEADSHKEVLPPTVYPSNIKTVYLNPLKLNVGYLITLEALDIHDDIIDYVTSRYVASRQLVPHTIRKTSYHKPPTFPEITGIDPPKLRLTIIPEKNGYSYMQWISAEDINRPVNAFLLKVADNKTNELIVKPNKLPPTVKSYILRGLKPHSIYFVALESLDILDAAIDRLYYRYTYNPTSDETQTDYVGHTTVKIARFKTTVPAFKRPRPTEPAIATRPTVPIVVRTKPTIPVITTRKTVPVVTTRKTASVLTTRKTAPVLTTRKTAPVLTTRKTAPVPTTRKTAPVPTTRKTAPVPTTRKTAPVPTTRKTAPVVRTIPTLPTIVNPRGTRPTTIKTTAGLRTKPALPTTIRPKPALPTTIRPKPALPSGISSMVAKILTTLRTTIPTTTTVSTKSTVPTLAKVTPPLPTKLPSLVPILSGTTVSTVEIKSPVPTLSSIESSTATSHTAPGQGEMPVLVLYVSQNSDGETEFSWNLTGAKHRPAKSYSLRIQDSETKAEIYTHPKIDDNATLFRGLQENGGILITLEAVDDAGEIIDKVHAHFVVPPYGVTKNPITFKSAGMKIATDTVTEAVVTTDLVTEAEPDVTVTDAMLTTETPSGEEELPHLELQIQPSKEGGASLNWTLSGVSRNRPVDQYLLKVTRGEAETLWKFEQLPGDTTEFKIAELVENEKYIITLDAVDSKGAIIEYVKTELLRTLGPSIQAMLVSSSFRRMVTKPTPVPMQVDEKPVLKLTVTPWATGNINLEWTLENNNISVQTYFLEINEDNANKSEFYSQSFSGKTSKSKIKGLKQDGKYIATLRAVADLGRTIEYVTVGFVMPSAGEEGKPVTESSDNRQMMTKSPTSGTVTATAAVDEKPVLELTVAPGSTGNVDLEWTLKNNNRPVKTYSLIFHDADKYIVRSDILSGNMSKVELNGFTNNKQYQVRLEALDENDGLIEYVTARFVMPPSGEEGEPVIESSDYRGDSTGDMITTVAPKVEEKAELELTIKPEQADNVDITWEFKPKNTNIAVNKYNLTIASDDSKQSLALSNVQMRESSNTQLTGFQENKEYVVTVKALDENDEVIQFVTARVFTPPFDEEAEPVIDSSDNRQGSTIDNLDEDAEMEIVLAPGKNGSMALDWTLQNSIKRPVHRFNLTITHADPGQTLFYANSASKMLSSFKVKGLHENMRYLAMLKAFDDKEELIEYVNAKFVVPQKGQEGTTVVENSANRLKLGVNEKPVLELTVTPGSIGNADLKWTLENSNNRPVQKYFIKFEDASKEHQFSKTLNGKISEEKITGLINNKQYQVRLEALDENDGLIEYVTARFVMPPSGEEGEPVIESSDYRVASTEDMITTMAPTVEEKAELELTIKPEQADNVDITWEFKPKNTNIAVNKYNLTIASDDSKQSLVLSNVQMRESSNTQLTGFQENKEYVVTVKALDENDEVLQFVTARVFTPPFDEEAEPVIDSSDYRQGSTIDNLDEDAEMEIVLAPGKNGSMALDWTLQNSIKRPVHRYNLTITHADPGQTLFYANSASKMLSSFKVKGLHENMRYLATLKAFDDKEELIEYVNAKFVVPQKGQEGTTVVENSANRLKLGDEKPVLELRVTPGASSEVDINWGIENNTLRPVDKYKVTITHDDASKTTLESSTLDGNQFSYQTTGLNHNYPYIVKLEALDARGRLIEYVTARFVMPPSGEQGEPILESSDRRQA
ncbi:uncharacterized protein LOC131954050 isoform X2 [Physella acuta]|uniref:uncharacterized protein LOC131954050 isoform X2 n=1 Tax=Physella acuta TaxID=109671 RepID=UPI0027DE9D29|nr:uncharacterized protein LOC131954050 isoform X2 [Physella acuta]